MLREVETPGAMGLIARRGVNATGRVSVVYEVNHCLILLVSVVLLM
jgi:hypothetical protein